MNRKDMEMFEMLTRIVGFGVSRQTAFPAGSLIGELLETLKSSLKTWSAESATYVSAGKAKRTSKTATDAAREQLRGMVAKIIHLNESVQGTRIALPELSRDRVLINEANGFLRDADSLREEFVRHALPAEFPAEVGAAVKELEQAKANYSAARATGSMARQNIAELIEEISVNLRKFDFLVANAFEGDSGVLAAYATARVIPRARVRTVPSKPEAAAKSAVA
jgi:hypothetical protein